MKWVHSTPIRARQRVPVGKNNHCGGPGVLYGRFPVVSMYCNPRGIESASGNPF